MTDVGQHDSPTCHLVYNAIIGVWQLLATRNHRVGLIVSFRELDDDGLT